MPCPSDKNELVAVNKAEFRKRKLVFGRNMSALVEKRDAYIQVSYILCPATIVVRGYQVFVLYITYVRLLLCFAFSSIPLEVQVLQSSVFIYEYMYILSAIHRIWVTVIYVFRFIDLGLNLRLVQFLRKSRVYV